MEQNPKSAHDRRGSGSLQATTVVRIGPAGIDGRFVTAGGALGGVVSKVACV
jgi:hypothetical protein